MGSQAHILNVNYYLDFLVEIAQFLAPVLSINSSTTTLSKGTGTGVCVSNGCNHSLHHVERIYPGSVLMFLAGQHNEAQGSRQARLVLSLGGGILHR